MSKKVFAVPSHRFLLQTHPKPGLNLLDETKATTHNVSVFICLHLLFCSQPLIFALIVIPLFFLGDHIISESPLHMLQILCDR